MHDRQRMVIVVASGLALAVAAFTINRLLADDGGAWFAYAPNTGATLPPEPSSGLTGPSTGEIWREAAVWLGAIAAWAALALWLYRRSPED